MFFSIVVMYKKFFDRLQSCCHVLTFQQLEIDQEEITIPLNTFEGPLSFFTYQVKNQISCQRKLMALLFCYNILIIHNKNLDSSWKTPPKQSIYMNIQFIFCIYITYPVWFFIFVAKSCLSDIHFLLLSLFDMLIFSYGNSDADNFTY